MKSTVRRLDIETEVQDMNLSYLKATYGSRPAVRRGMNLLDGGINSKDVDLNKLLRSHYEYDIKPEETYLRDDIDEVLHYYGVLELASLIGYVRLDNSAKEHQRIVTHLKYPPLYKYYARSYPIYLPQGLLVRLEGKDNFDSIMPARGFPQLVEFLSVSEQVNQDDEVNKFLWMLDDGIDNDGLNLDDFKSLLNNEDKLIKGLTKQRRRNSLDMALRGYSKFLSFSLLLYQFLRSADDYPLFQSACYHYHRYWYIRFDKKLGELSQIIDIVASRIGHNESGKSELEQDFRQDYSDNQYGVNPKTMLSVIEHLTDDRYGRIYLEAIGVKRERGRL